MARLCRQQHPPGTEAIWGQAAVSVDAGQRAKLTRSGHVANWALGVDREISNSSGVMSAGTLANNGVLRYRSPVSGSMARMFAPVGASAHTRKAPANVAPPVIPTKLPSFRANSPA